MVLEALSHSEALGSPFYPQQGKGGWIRIRSDGRADFKKDGVGLQIRLNWRSKEVEGGGRRDCLLYPDSATGIITSLELNP